MDSALRLSAWIEATVSKELENLDGLSRDQLLDLRIATLQKLDAAITARLGDATDTIETLKVEQPKQLTFAQAPLALAIPQFLATCTEPQTAKQIATALLEAGREFESNRPVHAVRMALSKLMGTNTDIFHVGWASWWLKSKCTKSQLDKYLAKNAKFGTGGHSKKEHSRRTAAGIQKFQTEKKRWGRALKATPELLDRARQMLRDGKTLTEVCETLEIAIPTLYKFGIRQRILKKEGELARHQQAREPDREPPADNGADVIPLHGRAG